MGGYSFRKLDYVRVVRLTKEQWETLTDLLENGRFWSPADSDVPIYVLDGTTIHITRKNGDEEKTVCPNDIYFPDIYETVNQLEAI